MKVGISNINKLETENIFKFFKQNSFSTFEHQILNKIIEVSFELGNYDSKFYIKIPTISALSSKTYIEFLHI